MYLPEAFVLRVGVFDRLSREHAAPLFLEGLYAPNKTDSSDFHELIACSTTVGHRPRKSGEYYSIVFTCKLALFILIVCSLR